MIEDLIKQINQQVRNSGSIDDLIKQTEQEVAQLRAKLQQRDKSNMKTGVSKEGNQ